MALVACQSSYDPLSTALDHHTPFVMARKPLVAPVAPGPCHLLDLPFEIRSRIYENLFNSTPLTFKIFEVDKHLFGWFRKEPLYRWIGTSPPPDSLLDTCRQIRYEALPELQRRLRVLCEIEEKAAAINSMNEIPLRKSLRSSIRSLHLIANTQYTFWPTNSMPHLQHVLIEGWYRPNVIIYSEASGTLDLNAPIILETIKSWHLDLLNEPEIPAEKGSWGMLQAILHPQRRFRLEWKGLVTVHLRHGLLYGAGCSQTFDLWFDWDEDTVIQGHAKIEELLCMSDCLGSNTG